MDKNQIIKSLHKDGFVVFNFGFNIQDHASSLSALERFLYPHFNTYPVIEKQQGWCELAVNLTKERHRFGGSGYNPLHMDFVNTTKPPLYLCLCCFRKDPLGGGMTLLSPTVSVLRELTEKEKNILRKKIYSEGMFFNLINVGEEYKQFPIIDESERLPWFRFSGKMLPPYGQPLNKKSTVLLRKIDFLLKKHLIKLMLNPGEVLILNQKLMLHGRSALGDDQAQLIPTERRLFYQGFLKSIVK